MRSSIDLDKRFKTTGQPSSNWPLVVCIYEVEGDGPEVLRESDLHSYHRCDFWLFGYVVKLPIEYSVALEDVPKPDEPDE